MARRKKVQDDDSDESLDAYDPYVRLIARIPPVKSWHARVYGHDATPLPPYVPIDVIGDALARVAAEALANLQRKRGEL